MGSYPGNVMALLQMQFMWVRFRTNLAVAWLKQLAACSTTGGPQFRPPGADADRKERWCTDAITAPSSRCVQCTTMAARRADAFMNPQPLERVRVLSPAQLPTTPAIIPRTSTATNTPMTAAAANESAN